VDARAADPKVSDHLVDEYALALDCREQVCRVWAWVGGCVAGASEGAVR
jgi:hypothetical protein